MPNPNIVFRSANSLTWFGTIYILDLIPKEQYRRYAEALLKYSDVSFLILGTKIHVKEEIEYVTYVPFIGKTLPLPFKPRNITHLEEYIFGSPQPWNIIPEVDVASYSHCSILFKVLQNEELLKKIKSSYKYKFYKDLKDLPNYSIYERLFNLEKYYCSNCIQPATSIKLGKHYCDNCLYPTSFKTYSQAGTNNKIAEQKIKAKPSEKIAKRNKKWQFISEPLVLDKCRFCGKSIATGEDTCYGCSR